MAGTADARLDLVEYEGDVLLVAEGAQFLHVAVRRDDVAAVSGDRLDEDGGDPAGAGVVDEVLQPVHAHHSAGTFLLPVEAAEAVRVGNLEAAGKEVGERLAAERVAGHRRHHHRLSHVAAEQRDDLGLTGGHLGHLDGALVGGGAARDLGVHLRQVVRGDLDQPPDQAVDRITLIGGGDVDDLVELVLHRGDDGRVGVSQAQVEGRRRAVEVALAVLVVEVDALTPRHLVVADGVIDVLGNVLGFHRSLSHGSFETSSRRKMDGGIFNSRPMEKNSDTAA